MIATIEKGTAYGRVEAPPSKSVSHRYLICGALSGGSIIENVAFSEDIKATLNCLKALFHLMEHVRFIMALLFSCRWKIQKRKHGKCEKGTQNIK